MNSPVNGFIAIFLGVIVVLGSMKVAADIYSDHLHEKVEQERKERIAAKRAQDIEDCANPNRSGVIYIEGKICEFWKDK